MTSAINALSGYTAAAASTNDTATATSASATSTAADKTVLDPQAFLQLLVTQLKYQDPSNPTDTSTFMNQTAMLSQVQTMNSMSTTLGSLASAQEAQTATNLIGKQVSYLDATGATTSGVVTSAALAASGATLQVGTATVALADITGVSVPTK